MIYIVGFEHFSILRGAFLMEKGRKMSVYLFVSSLVVSFMTMVSTIVYMNLDSESQITNYFGYKEICICLGISIVLMILGFIVDKREREDI